MRTPVASSVLHVLNKRLVPLVLAALLVPLSGCIAAEGFYDDMEEEWDDWGEDMEGHYEEWSEEWHEHDDDHHAHDDSWGDECEMEDEEDEGHDEDAVQVRPSRIENAYRDADPRYSNYVDGQESSERTISVGIGTDDLRVGLVHHLHGDVELRLRNPLGFTVALEEFDGSKEIEEDDWYRTERPMPGDWTLEIDLDDAYGGYTIGFYLVD